MELAKRASVLDPLILERWPLMTSSVPAPERPIYVPPTLYSSFTAGPHSSCTNVLQELEFRIHVPSTASSNSKKAQAGERDSYWYGGARELF